ncbi:cytochrome c biogenesis protein CcdA [uncultured Desulfovibrio sp.]|uniref:cytochrome c biogenesis CcdA family protein n=1 Tax=uncultured Desulfovibrio sp. TaxID=167968 RepID=UPI00262E42D0|nr:cytochrome c biogenesis protein CcdA [uncultured Desulfovibrio sp.]
MLEGLLIGINDMMLEHSWGALAACFLWGCASTLLSPCHLAAIPLLVSYVAGQPVTVRPRHAAVYALIFSLGLFSAVFLVGGACAVMGRMLGDIPSWGYAVAGFILVASGLRNVLARHCNIAWSWLYRWNFSGRTGAYLLGLTYGMLAGVCTFGFLAPILAVITIQGQLLRGILMTILFGLGHCLPIVLAGCGISVAETRGYKRFGLAMKRCANVFVMLFGLYFIAQAF